MLAVEALPERSERCPCAAGGTGCGEKQRAALESSGLGAGVWPDCAVSPGGAAVAEPAGAILSRDAVEIPIAPIAGLGFCERPESPAAGAPPNFCFSYSASGGGRRGCSGTSCGVARAYVNFHMNDQRPPNNSKRSLWSKSDKILQHPVPSPWTQLETQMKKFVKTRLPQFTFDCSYFCSNTLENQYNKIPIS